MTNGVIDLDASTAGTYTIKYVTTGNCPDSSTQDVTITGSCSNTPPYFLSLPVTNTYVDSLYTYTIVVNDSNELLSSAISSLNLPSWLTLVDNGNNTATLYGTSTNFGSYSININASDGDTSASQNFVIQVSKNCNNPCYTISGNVTLSNNTNHDSIKIKFYNLATGDTTPDFISFSDNFGNYSVSISPGFYYLIFEKNSYLPFSINQLTVSKDSTISDIILHRDQLLKFVD